MDPIAHTLAGASLAETGLKRTTRFGAAALIIGANLPDIDAIATFFGSDTALWLRRGWTHGALALALQPWLLALALWLLARHRPNPSGPAVSFRALLVLAYLGVLSHPFLDWLNTYGVRLLYPFNDRWFYGDALFIIDPWVWLMGASAVVLASSNSRVGIIAWSMLALAASTLVLGTSMVPWVAKALWVAALVAIVRVRRKPQHQRFIRPTAWMAIGLASLYILCMIGVSALARHHTRAFAQAHNLPLHAVMAAPLPAHPLARDIVMQLADSYRFYTWNPFAAETFQASHAAIAKSRWLGSDSRPLELETIIDTAMAKPEVKGLRHWLRFASYSVVPTHEGYIVHIEDVRYSRNDRTSLGQASVAVLHTELNE